MDRWNRWLPAMAGMLLLTSVSSAAQNPVTVDLRPARDNPPSPAMGDNLRFSSTITNTGAVSIEGIVAWISLVEIDAGNEQPMDLEDWSAQKAVTGAVLSPGESLKTDWPMRLIKRGDYRVVVSMTDRGGRRVNTSPIVQFHVREKPVLQAGRVVWVAAVIPFLISGWMVFNKTRQRRQRTRFEGPVPHQTV
jgi:hypothetical protein